MKKNEEDVNIYEIYLKDVGKYGTIDNAKTIAQLKIYRNGTEAEKKKAKEYIVGVHQRYVLSEANKRANKENLMDLVSEGNIGLMKAIEEYDIDNASNAKFTSYAHYWIRKAINDYIILEEPMVTPNNATKLSTYIPKIKKEFWVKNLRQPTIEEIQEILRKKYNLNFSNKEDLIAFQPMSIDERYESDEDGQEFMENSAYTSKTAVCDADSLVVKNDKSVIVNKVLSTLSEREAYILRCLYGIDCESKSMDDIAFEIGISHERVRQIANSSIDKLSKTCVGLAQAC